MTILAVLIPVSLCMGAVGLGAFFWSLRSGQFEDLDGDGQRILYDDDAPLAPSCGGFPSEESPPERSMPEESQTETTR